MSFFILSFLDEKRALSFLSSGEVSGSLHYPLRRTESIISLLKCLPAVLYFHRVLRFVKNLRVYGRLGVLDLFVQNHLINLQ